MSIQSGTMDEQTRAKRNAGYYAADMIEDNSIVGLGTGSTVFFMMERLAGRIREGLRVQKAGHMNTTSPCRPCTNMMSSILR
jgi:ribose 5-phosphate isomerase A